jgi:hypothetical protein
MWNIIGEMFKELKEFLDILDLNITRWKELFNNEYD